MTGIEPAYVAIYDEELGLFRFFRKPTTSTTKAREQSAPEKKYYEIFSLVKNPSKVLPGIEPLPPPI